MINENDMPLTSNSYMSDIDTHMYTLWTINVIDTVEVMEKSSKIK